MGQEPFAAITLDLKRIHNVCIYFSSARIKPILLTILFYYFKNQFDKALIML